MTTKTFTNSSNASRAAKKALGPEAKSGTDFFITKFSPTQYAWHKAGDPAPLAPEPSTVAPEAPQEEKPAKAAKAPKAKKSPKEPKAKKPPRKKSDSKIEEQPQMRRIIEMCSRVTGATIEEIAERFECEQHTIRGALSRLRGEGGVKVLDARIGRKKTFFAGDKAGEHKAAAEGKAG